MLIDVSENNGVIDWSKVKADPQRIEGAMIRTSMGYLYADKQATYNAHQCALLKIPFGYYHFATLNNINVQADAKQEAGYLHGLLENLPKATLPIAIDVERNEKNAPDITGAQLELYIQTFLDELRRLGHDDLWLYSGLYFIDTKLPKNHNLGTVPLWIAEYTGKPEPKLPHGWTSYAAYQYSATGKVSGIKGNVDCSKTTSRLA